MRAEIFKTSYGFTLIEVLTAVIILAILSSTAILVINPAQKIEDARYATAKESLTGIAKAAQIYANENGDYPADVARNLPQDFIEYLSPGAWPSGPFPGSVWDWDNWESQTCWDGSTDIIQITLRQINDYKGKTDYTIYYVIQGLGIPHCSNSSTKGECINCPSRYP